MRINATTEEDALRIMEMEFKGGRFLLDISEETKKVTSAHRLSILLTEKGLPCTCNTRFAPDTVQFHRPEHWNRSVI